METEKPKIKDDKKVERSNKSKSRKRGPKKEGKGNNLGTNSIKKNTIRAKFGGGLYNKTLTERNYEKIDRILSEQDVRKIVIEESKNIYYQVVKKLKINGRNFKDKVLAMYYIASNNLTMPKSFKEIEQMFNIPEAKIKKEYNRIKKLVKIELTVEQQNEILKSYIRTFCDENKENF